MLHLSLKLAGNADLMDAALSSLERLARLAGKNPNHLRFTLKEALANAVKHGHSEDRGRLIILACHACEDQFTVVITDTGDGFSPERVPDCMLPENLGKVTGRGIHLLKQYCQRVVWNEKGNSISLTF